MKSIKFYFGKKSAGVLGMENPDIIELEIQDEAIAPLVEKLTGEGTVRWVIVKGKHKTIYVNVQNILWFEIVDIIELVRGAVGRGGISDISKVAPIAESEKAEAGDK